MKETYVRAEMDIVQFSVEDVITTSNPNETPFVPYGYGMSLREYMAVDADDNNVLDIDENK